MSKMQQRQLTSGSKFKVDGPSIMILLLYREFSTSNTMLWWNLKKLMPRSKRIVEMQYFGGYELDEIAVATWLSLATFKRDLAFAKAWIFKEMKRV